MEIGTLSLIAVVSAVFSSVLAIGVAFIAPLFSHGVKLAEFRQAWINEQRKDVAEYIGLAREWVKMWDENNVVGGGTPERKKEFFDVTNKALVIYWRIKMRINPLQNNYTAQDIKFLQGLYSLLSPPPPDQNGDPSIARWRDLADQAVELAQHVFKTEWEVTKKTLLMSMWERWSADRRKMNDEIQRIQG